MDFLFKKNNCGELKKKNTAEKQISCQYLVERNYFIKNYKQHCYMNNLSNALYLNSFQ